jgi:diacylglycerol O-acyltransferase
MSQRLDRSRPLWETWVVEGIAGGRWGLISKIHHAMVDGISGVDLTQAVLETDPKAPLPPPQPWTPEPQPSRAELVLDAWRGLASDLARLGRAVVASAYRPFETAAKIAGLTAGLATFTGRLLALPWTPNPIHGTIGTHRSYAFASASLADVQEIRKALGGTVDDVILTAAAAGYRALLAKQGQNPDAARIRSLVPVSVRGPAERGTLGNQVSALLVDLPVHIADPLARLHQVRAEIGWLKASHMAEAGAVFTQLGDLAPPMLVGAITRGVARAMHRLPQRSFSTVTTNVPGPRETLYCLGRRMLAWYPYVPITQGIRVGLAILSYNGGVGFGVTADSDSVHDAGVLARGIEAGVQELLTLARDARIAGASPATQSVRAMA